MDTMAVRFDDRSPSSSNTAEPHGTPDSVKQAACLSCRRSKTRCLRNPGDVICKRCSQTDAECIIPEYRVGRKKGIKNKRDGLDKAVHRIEQAIKKSKAHGSQSEDDQQNLHLQNLLNEAQGLLSSSVSRNLISSQLINLAQEQRQLSPICHDSINALPRAETLGQNVSDDNDNFAVDDAENPLQLLARASDLSGPSGQTPYANSILSSVTLMPRAEFGRDHDHDLQTFFGPFRPSLDVGEEIDPIDMGLVTVEETDALFNYFYQNLSHTRWGLDPFLHTPNFVRSRSAFLFTSIMAGSALFLPTAAAVSKRLSAHCKFLARHVIANRSRSIEIVLAFMINIPWMSPGKHWSDDETCSYMAMALTIAMDVSLNKLVLRLGETLANTPRGTAISDCITARKALDLDGFPDVDPVSTFGRRLLRSRERVWLALFVLDRGVCLARGRPFTVPLTSLIETCDDWHKSALSDVWDSSIISSAVLRRDLARVILHVKETCDRNRAVTASALQEMVDDFFNQWYGKWMFAIGGNNQSSIPPYVEILVTHGRLSIYSSVINHPTAPMDVKRFFRAAGLSSALNVMRASVQGENRLKSMPNNTAIMISFAAMLSIQLTTMGEGTNSSLAPSIRILIMETADVLERIGANPSHRNGTSALYGRHLRQVIRNSGISNPPSRGNRPPDDLHQQPQFPTTQPQAQSSSYQTQPNGPADLEMAHLLQFSAMSDDQIVQAINDAGDELGSFVPNMQIDERTGLDWLDWFNMENNV